MLTYSGTRIRFVFLFTLLSVVALTGASYGSGQTSSSYTIPSDVLSSGGATISSAAYELAFTQGQPSAIGISTSNSFKNSAGFWPAALSTAGGQSSTCTLSVSVAPQNAGSVKDAGSLNCPPTCSDIYDQGAQVTLTATPTVGYQFDRWEGDAASAENPLLITLNKDTILKALFVEGDRDTPAVNTGGSSEVTDSSARLAGVVNPNGLDTTYYFIFGTTNCFGDSTDVVLLAAGYDEMPIDFEITNLNDNTTYHYQLVASNSQGTTYGSISTFITQSTGVGSSPKKPELTSPVNNTQGNSLLQTFYTGRFSDPDPGDRHLQTEWQVSESCDFTTIVFEKISSHSLYQLTIPHLDLLPDTAYYWRVRYYDDQLNHSDWSDPWMFQTRLDPNDQNMNGLPDNLEDATLDLDNNGIADSQEDRIKSIWTAVGNCSVGISYAAQGNIIGIEAMDSIDHTTISNIVRPYDMPMGLVGFRLLVNEPGDTASVTLRFCQAIPEDTTWYNFNSVDGWSDFSEKAVFSPDRTSLRLELEDGGRGDADGVANGIIVDPCGSGVATFLEGRVFDVETEKDIGHANIYIDEFIVKVFENNGQYLTMILPGQYPIIAYAQGYETLFDTIEVDKVITATHNIGLKPIIGNSAPTVFITSPGSNMTIKAGEQLVFRCTVVNGDGELTYTWDFDGGTTNSNLQYPGIVTFHKEGTYEVLLTVKDDDGNTGKDIIVVSVLNVPKQPPGNGGGGGGGGCFLSAIFN